MKPKPQKTNTGDNGNNGNNENNENKQAITMDLDKHNTLQKATVTKDVPATTPTFKVVLLGDSGVGKTSIRAQFVHHVFSNNYKATIGGDYLTTTMSKGKKHPQLLREIGSDLDSQNINLHDTTEKVNLQIWDTAGQERFNSISKAFYRGADIVVLCYDITNYESVLSLRDWFLRFIEHCYNEHPGVIIVGNKADKVKDRVVDKEEIEDILQGSGHLLLENRIGEFVADWETDLFEVSAKKFGEVEKVFRRVATLASDLQDEEDFSRRSIRRDIVDLNDGIKKQSKSNNCAC